MYTYWLLTLIFMGFGLLMYPIFSDKLSKWILARIFHK